MQKRDTVFKSKFAQRASADRNAGRIQTGASSEFESSALKSILKNSLNNQNLKFDYEEEVRDGYTEYFSLGCDYEGQLGHGQEPSQHDRNRHVTVPKSLSFDILIKSVSCGGAHTLILSKTGDLFSIGSNEFGQLGLNDRQLKFTTAPLLIQEAKNMGVVIKQIATGSAHNMILTDSGQIFSWGSNYKGECGQNIKHYEKIFSPQRVFSQEASNNIITQIECGDNFSGFVTELGSCFSFGSNSDGQLGINQDLDYVHIPSKVYLDEEIQQISFGYRHSLMLTKRGAVFGCGTNTNFQLGLGDKGHNKVMSQQWEPRPIKIESLTGLGIVKVIAGGFSAALTTQNQILVWGEGDFGTFKTPQKLYMDQVNFTDCQISKFQHQSTALAVDQSGKVFAWGHNSLGQLGHGDTRNRKLPTQIQALKRKTIKNLAVGDSFIVMLGKDVSLAEQKAKKEKKRLRKQLPDETSLNESNLYKNIHKPEEPQIQSHPSFGEFEKQRSKSFKDFSAQKPNPEVLRNNSENRTPIASNKYLKEMNERSTRTQQLLNRVNGGNSSQRDYLSNNSAGYDKSFNQNSGKKFDFTNQVYQAPEVVQVEVHKRSTPTVQIELYNNSAPKFQDGPKENSAPKFQEGPKENSAPKFQEVQKEYPTEISPGLPLVSNRTAPCSPKNFPQDNFDSVSQKLRVRQLEIQLETLNNRNEFLEKQLEDKRKDFEKRLQAVTTDQQTTLREREALNKKYLEEKRLHDEVYAEKNRIQTENSKLKGDIHELEIKQSRIAEESHMKILEQNHGYKAQIDEVKNYYEKKALDLEQDIREMETKMDQREQKITQQAVQIKNDEDKIAQLEMKLKEKENQIKDFNQEKDDLRQRAQKAEQKLSDQVNDMDKLERQNRQLKLEQNGQKDMMDNRDKDIRQLNEAFVDLKGNFESQIKVLTQENQELGSQLNDAVDKNKKLIQALNEKQNEAQSTFRTVEESQIQKSHLEGENRRLEALVSELQNKNLKLNQLMDQNAFNRAEIYKNKILETLQKPKPVDSKREYDRYSNIQKSYSPLDNEQSSQDIKEEPFILDLKSQQNSNEPVPASNRPPVTFKLAESIPDNKYASYRSQNSQDTISQSTPAGFGASRSELMSRKIQESNNDFYNQIKQLSSTNVQLMDKEKQLMERINMQQSYIQKQYGEHMNYREPPFRYDQRVQEYKLQRRDEMRSSVPKSEQKQPMLSPIYEHAKEYNNSMKFDKISSIDGGDKSPLHSPYNGLDISLRSRSKSPIDDQLSKIESILRK